jgi:hypothetical protein
MDYNVVCQSSDTPHDVEDRFTVVVTLHTMLKNLSTTEGRCSTSRDSKELQSLDS